MNRCILRRLFQAEYLHGTIFTITTTLILLRTVNLRLLRLLLVIVTEWRTSIFDLEKCTWLLEATSKCPALKCVSIACGLKRFHCAFSCWCQVDTKGVQLLDFHFSWSSPLLQSRPTLATVQLESYLKGFVKTLIFCFACFPSIGSV